MEETEAGLESVAEEKGMGEALAVVLGHAEEEGTVEWADVRSDLTSGQWGRLIGSGVLIDAGNQGGFVLDDPEAVRELLVRTDRIDAASLPAATDARSPNEVGEETIADDAGTGDEPATDRPTDTEGDAPAETSNWTTYDKVAAVAALGLMGFEISGNRTLIGQLMNTVYGPLESVLPFYAIVIVLALFLGAYSTVLQSKLRDTELIGRRQERMNDIQERRKEAKERGDDEALEAIEAEQMEAMGEQLGTMKAQFRPMVWIVLLTIPAYLWMYWMVQGHIPAGETAIVLPLAGQVTWTDAVAGPLQAWLLWYFLCSIASRQVLQKALGIRTSPTPTSTES
jgi:uncharacterized membrane protein (DUF106 family)